MSAYMHAYEALIIDPRYLRNLDWGEPRDGHPEGTVRAHIEELEANLELFRSRVSEAEYWKLKLLVHTHDTLKGEAQPGVPILDPRSHASLARALLSDFSPDADLHAMVQFHDEPFALWRQVLTKGSCNAQRLTQLLGAVADWDLFAAFLIIDGCTEGKSRDWLQWFLPELQKSRPTRFGERDLILPSQSA